MAPELDALDAEALLDALDTLVDSIDQHVSGEFTEHVDPSLWDDYRRAMDTLRSYGRREPRKF